MAVLEENMKRINSKLQQLLKSYRFLQKENLQQGNLIESLQQQKQKDAEQLSTLKEQVAILKAATLQMNDVDKKAFEKSISEYIREIDKCINLLSD